MMIIHATKPLFAWDCLEDSPSLQTIRDLLAALPDGKLLNSLRTARGKGRDDFPVTVLWGVVVLRVALRHVTMEAGDGNRDAISIGAHRTPAAATVPQRADHLPRWHE